MFLKFWQRILKCWYVLIDRVINPLVRLLSRTKPNSWLERKQQIFFYCLKQIPSNWFCDAQVSNKTIENNYDKVSGSYTRQLDRGGRKKWSIIKGDIVKVDTTESRSFIRKEMWGCISSHQFDSILEVGVGELRTINYVRDIFADNKSCYGIDLSLNRLCHGYETYCIQNDFKVTLAKANAAHLPFKDKSIDIVYSVHCLELMPKDQFKKAIKEMCRVARQHVFLFEPSWELGGYLQRMKMASEKYVRGIPKFITSELRLELNEYRLLDNHVNPFNKTALHHILLTDSDLRCNSSEYVCPNCHGSFDYTNSYFFCKSCHSLFFIYKKIPVLDPAYSHKVTCPIAD